MIKISKLSLVFTVMGCSIFALFFIIGTFDIVIKGVPLEYIVDSKKYTLTGALCCLFVGVFILFREMK